MAGTLVVEKIVGAAAEAGADLGQCKELRDWKTKATAFMRVTFTDCTVPAAGRANFDIGDDEMEVNVGPHENPGGAEKNCSEQTSSWTSFSRRSNRRRAPSRRPWDWTLNPTGGNDLPTYPDCCRPRSRQAHRLP